MHYSAYKTILSPQNGMNLYRGCVHGCIYCDSRSLCYQMKHDFEDIEIKQNAPLILDSQLRRRRKRGIISTGAMCDPYLPFPETLAITRDCLSVIERHGFGIALLTKSASVVRDIDILTAINRNARAVIQMTLTTFDESLCKILEPNVSTTAERLSALEKFTSAGIDAVVWLSPILPFINDTEENLRGILAGCVKAGVKAIVCFGFGTTMRDGSRDYFYAKLDEHFPGMKHIYEREFGGMYSCHSRNEAMLTQILKSECARHNILCETKEAFEFIGKFSEKENKGEQLSLW